MSFDVSESLAAGENAADVVPQDLESGASTSTRRRTASITHGAGVSVVVDDGLEVYDHLRELWRSEVGDPGDRAVVDADIDFLPEGRYKWVFKSSGWKAGAENGAGTWKRWYEYHIRLRREEIVNGERSLEKPSTSCAIDVEPQDDRLTYEDGNDVSLPFGEGSRLSIKTTYAERSGEVIDRLFSSLADAIEALGVGGSIMSAAVLVLVAAYLYKGAGLVTTIAGLAASGAFYIIVSLVVLATAIGAGWIEPNPSAFFGFLSEGLDVFLTHGLDFFLRALA